MLAVQHRLSPPRMTPFQAHHLLGVTCLLLPWPHLAIVIEVLLVVLFSFLYLPFTFGANCTIVISNKTLNPPETAVPLRLYSDSSSVLELILLSSSHLCEVSSLNTRRNVGRYGQHTLLQADNRYSLLEVHISFLFTFLF